MTTIKKHITINGPHKFLVPNAYTIYVSTILLSIKCAIVLCLKNNGYTLIKNTVKKATVIWVFKELLIFLQYRILLITDHNVRQLEQEKGVQNSGG